MGETCFDLTVSWGHLTIIEAQVNLLDLHAVKCRKVSGPDLLDIWEICLFPRSRVSLY